MTDRQLFQKAVKNLPSLALPLFAILLAQKFLEDTLPRALAAGWLAGIKDIGSINYFWPIVWGILFLLLGAVMDFVALGSHRLCLDRGEGRQGQMPWTILGQWRKYKSWILWMILVPILWKYVRGVLLKLLVYNLLDYNLLDRMTIIKLSYWSSYYNIALLLLSYVLLTLLRLAVQTAYLRAPERGFWRAVGFGLKEGFQKWPKTIGAQIKFVVPASIGVTVITFLLSRLAAQIGGPGISHICNLIGWLVNTLATVWIMVFYGCLAAERYDPPQERYEVMDF